MCGKGRQECITATTPILSRRDGRECPRQTGSRGVKCPSKGHTGQPSRGMVSPYSRDIWDTLNRILILSNTPCSRPQDCRDSRSKCHIPRDILQGPLPCSKGRDVRLRRVIRNGGSSLIMADRAINPGTRLSRDTPSSLMVSPIMQGSRGIIPMALCHILQRGRRRRATH